MKIQSNHWAQNNGQSKNNVRPEWCLDQPKVPLAGHVDSEVTETPILEQTAKHSPVKILSLCKNTMTFTNTKLHKD